VSDSYRPVTCQIAAVRPKAVEVIVPNRKGTHWIPRSLLHYADDRAMDDLIPVVEHSFRVREWKAEELGLAG
jgi:hypothetical protein